MFNTSQARNVLSILLSVGNRAFFSFSFSFSFFSSHSFYISEWISKRIFKLKKWCECLSDRAIDGANRCCVCYLNAGAGQKESSELISGWKRKARSPNKKHDACGKFDLDFVRCLYQVRCMQWCRKSNFHSITFSSIAHSLSLSCWLLLLFIFISFLCQCIGLRWFRS